VSTHLLALSDKAGIVDASIAPMAEEIWEKVSSYVDTLDFIFITHAHFDHVGAIPFLREKAPHLKVVAGRQTADLLADKDYVENLRQKNLQASEGCNFEFSITQSDWYLKLQVDLTLSDGDNINLGEGVEVKLIETPGHTSDSVCYYVKPDLALAAGESLGQYSGRDSITPSYGSSYQDSIKSFQKLNALEIHILSLPHSGVITGNLVNKYMTELPIEMERFKKAFSQRIIDGELIEEIVANVSAEWAEEGRFPEGPFHDAHKELVNQMVKNSRED